MRCSPDYEEQTLIVCDTISGRVSIDTSRSGPNAGTDRDGPGGPLRILPAESVELHVFVDGCVVEVFVNGRTCVTELVYPPRADSVDVNLFARGGQAKLSYADVWALESTQGDASAFAEIGS